MSSLVFWGSFLGQISFASEKGFGGRFPQLVFAFVSSFVSDSSLVFWGGSVVQISFAGYTFLRPKSFLHLCRRPGCFSNPFCSPEVLWIVPRLLVYTTVDMFPSSFKNLSSQQQ